MSRLSGQASNILEIPDFRAGSLIDKLERFLGLRNVDRRLKSVERELSIERGVYKSHWLVPNREWWLGLQKAREIRRAGLSFRGRLDDQIKVPLETAAKIDLLYRQLPLERRTEFKQRILAADNLQPVLMEIDIASHFAQKGCGLEWTSNRHGRRVSEFVARRGAALWEVECKTKGCDAGRRVSRPAFLRLVDLLGPLICDLGLQGTCDIRVADRMPITPTWRSEAAHWIKAAIADGKAEFSLNDGGRVRLALRAQEGTALPQREIDRIQAEKGLHEHVAFYGPLKDHLRVDPVIITVSSEKPDAYLADILSDLRDACKQFTGSHASLICCFIPEIQSFAELAKSSALNKMTHFFFERYASPLIHSVVYSSDSQSTRLGRIEETYSPALRFDNPGRTVAIPDDVLLGRHPR